jgi:hypothetical protein
MEKSLYDRILDAAGPDVLNDCRVIYREVAVGQNDVLLISGRHFSPLRARISAVTRMNRYSHRAIYLVTRDRDNLILLKTSRQTKSGRHVGDTTWLAEPLCRRPIIAPIKPGPRSRISPLAGRQQERLAA